MPNLNNRKGHAEQGSDKVFSILRTVALSFALLCGALPAGEGTRLHHMILAAICLALLVPIACLNIITSKDKTKFVLFLKSPIFISITAYLLLVILNCCLLSAADFGVTVITQLTCIVLYNYLTLFVFVFVPKKPSELFPGLYLLWASTFIFSAYNTWLGSHPNKYGYGTELGTGTEAIAAKNRIADIASACPFFAFAVLTKRKLLDPLSIVFVLSAITGITSILLTNARAAFISIPISLILILLLQSKRPKQLIGRLLFSLLITAIMLASVKLMPEERQETFIVAGAGATTLEIRENLWQQSISYLLKHPFSPVGLSHKAGVLGTATEVISNPCNFFMQDWIENGLPAAVCYLAYVISSFIMLGLNIIRFRDSKQLSILSAFCMAVFIERICRDIQDVSSVGWAMAMTPASAVGIGLLLHLGAQKSKLIGQQTNQPPSQ